MKHFINVSSFRSQNKEMLKKALYNLFNLKKLSVVAGRNEDLDEKGLRPLWNSLFRQGIQKE